MKVVYSVSSPGKATKFVKNTLNCVAFKDITSKDLSDIATEDFTHVELMKMATKYSDGIILDDAGVDPSIAKYAESLGIPVLGYQGDTFEEAYSQFYDKVMGE